MSRVFLPSQLNKKVEFGRVVSEEDQNTGINHAVFKPDFQMHAKVNKRTVYQTYQAEQAGMLDTRSITIRHNAKVNDSIKCKLAGVVYDIVSVNSDESFGINKYDTVLLRKNKKLGDQYDTRYTTSRLVR